MENLSGKTLFITGASRGIGKAIALRAACDGANIVVVAKTVEPHPKLPGTIFTAASEIEAAGGRALPLAVDIRDESAIENALKKAADFFGGIDILVNNASAINLTSTEKTSAKKFDLMMAVNVRGAFFCSQMCLPYLKVASNPHILTLAPPINLNPKWFVQHSAYTISKYGMSMCVLGMAAEFKSFGIAVNALWPQTAIDTAALRMLGDLVRPQNCRKVDIVADAAHYLLTRNSRDFTGQFYIDEKLLQKSGVTNFSKYAVAGENELFTDFFID